MPRSDQLIEQLQQVLPFERVIQDLHADLDANPGEIVLVEVETGVIEIPKKVEASEVAKVMQYDCPEKYASFRVILAVGGVESYRSGITTPRLCFARLNYNADVEFVSVDYYVGY